MNNQNCEQTAVSSLYSKNLKKRAIGWKELLRTAGAAQLVMTTANECCGPLQVPFTVQR